MRQFLDKNLDFLDYFGTQEEDKLPCILGKHYPNSFAEKTVTEGDLNLFAHELVNEYSREAYLSEQYKVITGRILIPERYKK